MANFHTNYFVVAADEGNMCKVLARMAMNLAANKEYTGFDLASIDGVNSAQGLYRQVESAIVAWYIFAFAGAPIPEDVAARNTPGWASPTSSEGGFMLQLAAMVQATEKFNTNAPEGVSIGLTATAPTARGLSDTASVSFTKYGGNWVLTIMYDTAWSPNSEDLDTFFMGLPEGSYGVAFFDADEYDGYESISAFSGLHHGLAGMQDLDGDWDFGVYDASDIKVQKREYASVAKSEVDDIAKLARIAALSGWNQFGWDDEDEIDFDGGGYSMGYMDAYSVDWRNPSASDLSSIDNAITQVLEKFPWVIGVTGSAYEGREENVEGLVPGDLVKILANWNNPYFNPCALEIYTADGRRIGNLDNIWGEAMQLEDIERTAIACILPHIKAYAEVVEPLTTKDGRSRHSKVTVRLEVNDQSLASIFDEVHALLKKSIGKRELTSDLEGAK